MENSEQSKNSQPADASDVNAIDTTAQSAATNQSSKKKAAKKSTNPLIAKAFLMIAFTIILSIPMVLISGLVDSREHLQADAVSDIKHALGGESVTTGPYVRIPFEKTEYGKQVEDALLVFPDFFTTDIQIQTEILERGIYPVPTFEASLNGDFFFNLSLAKKEFPDLDWSKALLIFEVDNTKGIVEIPRLILGETIEPMRPGQAEGEFMNKRLEYKLNLQTQNSFSGRIEGKFRGVESFSILPIAGSNKMSISSDWASPDIGQGLIAASRHIEDGLSRAEWNVTRLHTGLPEYAIASYFHSSRPDAASYIEFNLYQENSLYQKTYRALSYGMFIICLAYVVFFLIDLKADKSLHALQYLVLGAGFALFYLLLLALSEYISFQYAYIAASISIIWISAFYYGSITNSFKRGSLLAAAYALIFAYIYFVIASVEYALIAGAIGLLAIFYAVAFSTRKLKQLNET